MTGSTCASRMESSRQTQHDYEPGSRIYVVGTTGSGKTTLAREIARRLRMPQIELDALHWESGWTPAPPGRFPARVADAVKGVS